MRAANITQPARQGGAWQSESLVGFGLPRLWVQGRITLITYRFSHVLIERVAEQLGGQPQARADEAPRRRDFGDQRRARVVDLMDLGFQLCIRVIDWRFRQRRRQ